MTLNLNLKNVLVILIAAVTIHAHAQSEGFLSDHQLGLNRFNTATCVKGTPNSEQIGKVQYFITFDQEYSPENSMTHYSFKIGVSLITEIESLSDVQPAVKKPDARFRDYCGEYTSSATKGVFAWFGGTGSYSGKLKPMPNNEFSATSSGMAALKAFVANVESDVMPLPVNIIRTRGSVQGVDIWTTMLNEPRYKALEKIAAALQANKDKVTAPGIIYVFSKTPGL